MQDDAFLGEIMQTSLSLFHTNLIWPGYRRTFDQDFQRAVQLANRANCAPLINKTRWFMMLSSDPARISWEGCSDPLIAGNLVGDDVAGLAERSLANHVEFLAVFFGGYLTHVGDFASADTFYQDLVRRGLSAEGYLGLADIHHLLANWREETREFEDRNVYPRRGPIPSSCEKDLISKLEFFGYDAAIGFYRQAVEAAPNVSFYRMHLARCLIDSGDLDTARTELEIAAKAANPNPFVTIYLNFVDRLARRVARSSGDFLPTVELRERYQSLVAAPLVDVDTLAVLEGSRPVTLCEETRLNVNYAMVTDGRVTQMPLDLQYPAIKGLPLAATRDLGAGLKLASEQFLISDGPEVGVHRLKMFARSILATGDKQALVGLPRIQETVRSDRPVVPMPGVGSNYYHWIIDSLGAASLLDRQVGRDAVDYVINRPLNPWQKEVLDLALPGLRVQVLTGPTEHRVLENAFHLPPPARLYVPHPEAVRLLRARLSRHTKPRKGKRVWIGRAGLRGRATVNETAIQAHMLAQGFEVFDPSGKSIAEQIAFFADVEVLASLGGAALTNQLFCPDETKVIMLSAAFHYHETYTALAGIIGQPCWVCLGHSETRPNPYLIWSVFDQTISLESVALTVDQAVNA